MPSYGTTKTGIPYITIYFPTRAELQAMTVEDLAQWLDNNVYAVTQPVEEMEYHGKFIGNGHHMRQTMAKFAADHLRSRKIKPPAP